MLDKIKSFWNQVKNSPFGPYKIVGIFLLVVSIYFITALLLNVTLSSGFAVVLAYFGYNLAVQGSAFGLAKIKNDAIVLMNRIKAIVWK